MRHVLDEARRLGASRATLEVRAVQPRGRGGSTSASGST